MDVNMLKTLIKEGEEVLSLKYEKDDGIAVRNSFSGERHMAVINTYVPDDLFNKLYEKVKIFLKTNDLEDSIVRPNSLHKNYDITKKQIAKLRGIYELQTSTGDLIATECRDFNVFIGHGHHLLWTRVALHLLEDYNIKSVYYENQCRVDVSIDDTIEEFLQNNKIKFAIFTLMKEDETADSNKRARQNVIHELGIFRSRLNSKRVAMIVVKW